eukprot:309410-Chlamydomonas_euryale.AAC.5
MEGFKRARQCGAGCCCVAIVRATMRVSSQRQLRANAYNAQPSGLQPRGHTVGASTAVAAAGVTQLGAVVERRHGSRAERAAGGGGTH